MYLVVSVHRAVSCVQVNEGKIHTDDHRLYVAWVTQELLSMIDNGKDLDDTLTIHFPAPATIRTMEIFETAWKAPPDKFMEEPDYLLAHGDPDTNGKQDRRQKQEGRTMVKLWEPKIWKLTKKRITQQQRYREENPGDSELEQKMAQDRFSAFGESLGVGDRQKAYGDTDDGDAKKKAAKAGEDDVDVEGTDKYEFFKKASSSSDKVATPSKASTGATTKAVAAPAAATGEQLAKGTKAQKLAKCKPSAKKTAGGGRGRPPESRKELVLAGLRQLRYADGSAVICFGTEWKNVNRNWTSYMKGLESEIEDASELQSEELIVLHRTMKSARLVLVAANQYGIGSAQARAVFAQERASLSLNCPRGSSGDPAYNPWPVYLTSSIKASNLSDAWPAERFWQQMTDSEMKLDFSEEFQEQQLVFSYEKIETLCNEMGGTANEAIDLCICI